jgi:membrane-bound lytic murein transglycosylase D
MAKGSLLFIVFAAGALILSSCSTKKINYSYNETYLDKDEEIILEEESKKTGLKIPNRWEIKKYLIYYTRKDKHFIKTGLENAQIYLPIVKGIFKRENIPEDLAYLPLIESKFNPYAVSSSGAAGLWQFLPSTGRRFGLIINSQIDERKDPYKSTIAAAKYLKYLYSLFGRWDLAIAAYNCGEGCIQREIDSKNDDFWDIKNDLPKQTREYVPRFFAALLIARRPEKYGIYIKEKPVYIVRKTAKTTFSLKKLADRYDLDYNLLSLFNAHLKRKIAYKGVEVNIPVKNKYYASKAKENIDVDIVKKVSYQYKIYRIKRGDTLYSIAKRYKVDIETLMKVNKLSSYNIKAGQILKIPVND